MRCVCHVFISMSAPLQALTILLRRSRALALRPCMPPQVLRVGANVEEEVVARMINVDSFFAV